VHPLAKGIEVLAPVGTTNDDLAVEHVASGWKHELREVAPERPAVARLEEHLIAVDERKAAKAVELDLVGVLLAHRQLFARDRQLGLDRRREREGHELEGCLIMTLRPSLAPDRVGDVTSSFGRSASEVPIVEGSALRRLETAF
jgi:hypothetical protein